MFWLGSLTCAILMIYYDYNFLAAGTPEEIERFARLLNGAMIGFYSSDIAANLFSTGTTTLFCFVI